MNWSRPLTEYQKYREDMTFHKANFGWKIDDLIQYQIKIKDISLVKYHEEYQRNILENIELAKMHLAEYEKVKEILGCDPGPCKIEPERLQAAIDNLGFK